MGVNTAQPPPSAATFPQSWLNRQPALRQQQGMKDCLAACWPQVERGDDIRDIVAGLMRAQLWSGGALFDFLVGWLETMKQAAHEERLKAKG